MSQKQPITNVHMYIDTPVSVTIQRGDQTRRYHPTGASISRLVDTIRGNHRTSTIPAKDGWSTAIQSTTQQAACDKGEENCRNCNRPFPAGSLLRGFCDEFCEEQYYSQEVY
jgi:hypothetical protein